MRRLPLVTAFLFALLMHTAAACAPVGAPLFVLPPLGPRSLLDEVGRLGEPVPDSDAAGWRSDLSRRQSESPLVDQEHIWLGEYLLAHDEQPELAEAQFQNVISARSGSASARGLAQFDSAMAEFYRGAYRDAADDFEALLTDKSGLRDFPRRDCALWYRHSLACANYHSDNARKGVPEPPSLHPMCGAAAIASSLRSLSLPFGRQYIVNALRPSGEGSTFAQLVASA
jgi:hypothetical protein